MALAYVDTSCLVSIAFREPGSSALRRRLERFEELFASNLLEAELRAALRREGVTGEPELAEAMSWIIPHRPLGPEIARVLEAGYVRGADCWHVATALYLAGDPTALHFVTLDERQGAVAARLGFPT
jgi:predicted nucleic acid-binding protein